MSRSAPDRILTVIDSLGAGGRQRAAQNYSLGYLAAGCDSALVAVLDGGPREAPLREAGIPVYVGGASIAAQQAAVALGAEWRPSVIHLHSSGPPIPAVASAVEALLDLLPARIPVLETTSFGKVDYQRRYTSTDVHLLMTRWALWRWSKWSRPLRPRPVGVVVPITVDVNSFFPESRPVRLAYRSRHDIPEAAVVIGCVARPDPIKWPKVTFKAFREVAGKYPQVHLVVAGITDEARRWIAGYPYHIRRRVIELPLIADDDELRACYSSMDVFLHASRIGESFGLVFIEAMACETPVITLSTPAKNNSQLEVVGHERGGLIANDYRGMVEAMQHLVERQDVRDDLGRRGAEYVRSHFTLDQVMPVLLRIASIADSALTSEELAAALEADPELTTIVTDSQISSLLAKSMGSLPMRQRILKHLVHVPLFYRAWRSVRS